MTTIDEREYFTPEPNDLPRLQIIKFFRRPNGDKTIKVKARIHGRTVEEELTQTEIERYFDNM